MSLRERVESLFDEKRMLMSMIWDTEPDSPGWRQISRRHSDVVRELSEILQASLQGRFRVEECVIDKRMARVRITNDILSIPVSVRYSHIGLSEFRRSPGSRQAEKHRAAIMNLVASAELFGWYKCEVGSAGFEVVDDRGVERRVTNIRVIA